MATNELIWRLGLAYATNLVPKSDARATLSAPGSAYTLAFGGGKEFAGGKYAVDLGGEYSFSSGEGQSTDSTTIRNFSGDFEAKAYVLHTSFKYRF